MRQMQRLWTGKTVLLWMKKAGAMEKLRPTKPTQDGFSSTSCKVAAFSASHDVTFEISVNGDAVVRYTLFESEANPLVADVKSTTLSAWLLAIGETL